MRKFDYLQLYVALACLVIFIILAIGVFYHAGYIDWLDQLGERYIREPVTDDRSWFFRNITRGGNPKWTALVMAITVFISLLIRKYDVAVFLIVNVGFFGLGAMAVIKNILQRPRPNLWQIVPESGFSFPSGHTLNSVLLYGSLIVLVHYYIHNDQVRYAFMTLLAGLMFGIPISRVYLGVHYLTDILGGYSLGFFFLIISKEFIFKYRTREVFEHAQHSRFSANDIK